MTTAKPAGRWRSGRWVVGATLANKDWASPVRHAVPDLGEASVAVYAACGVLAQSWWPAAAYPNRHRFLFDYENTDRRYCRKCRAAVRKDVMPDNQFQAGDVVRHAEVPPGVADVTVMETGRCPASHPPLRAICGKPTITFPDPETGEPDEAHADSFLLVRKGS